MPTDLLIASDVCSVLQVRKYLASTLDLKTGKFTKSIVFQAGWIYSDGGAIRPTGRDLHGVCKISAVEIAFVGILQSTKLA